MFFYFLEKVRNLYYDRTMPAVFAIFTRALIIEGVSTIIDRTLHTIMCIYWSYRLLIMESLSSIIKLRV